MPTPAASEQYKAAGFVIEVAGTNGPIIEAIRTLFALCPPHKGQEPPDLRITGALLVADHNPLPPWLTETLHNLPDSPEPRFFCKHNTAAVIGKQGPSLAVAWLSPDRRHLHFCANRVRGMLTPLTVQPIIVPLLRECFLAEQKLLLHSAALSLPNETGLLIAAPGYGGKSTTTMSLLRLGAKLLGDDLSLILPGDGAIQALAIPEPFNLTAETLGFFPECQAVPPYLAKPTPDSKQVYSPLDLYGPDCLSSHCTLGQVYFVRITTGKPAARRLQTAEAMRQFAAAHMFARNQLVTPWAINRLLELVARLHIYELHTGADPVALGHWLLDHAIAQTNSQPGA